MGGDPIGWLSKRQSRIALSSNDAEIYAAAECIREGLAVSHVRQELGIPQKGAIEIFEDNAQTILAGERGLSGPRTVLNICRSNFISFITYREMVR